MATAYAAVVSLMHIMEQIHDALHQIFLDVQQRQIQYLNESVSFFQDFLEGYSTSEDSKEMSVLESQIADAAHTAGDIIETRIVDCIHDRSNSQEKWRSNSFSQELLKIIEDVDLIKKEVLEMKEKCRLMKDLQPRGPTPASSSSPPSLQDAMMVFDEDLNYIMNMLTSQQSNRQVIPITRMGGIGKTTLAKNVYESLSIVKYFDLRGWATISQRYDEQEILLCLLKETGALNGLSESLDNQNLGVELYEHLSGQRYLIIFDDMWSIGAWDKLKPFVPDNKNGSRIMVTTRIPDVANSFGSSSLYQMNLLDEDKSWSLLCKKVFIEKNCPPELVETGKAIAKNSHGLPLSIGVIGRLIAKSKMVREYWEYVAENTRTTISSNDEERCLEIVSFSYRHLPIHLKPCFLYMGVFSEDHEIRVSKLIRLWVAEGFLKSSREKSLEQVAKDYLIDLIDRNLKSITKLGSTCNVKYCKIHDLLRALCLREAHKAKFLHIKTLHRPSVSQSVDSHFEIDRVVIELNSPDILNGTDSKRRIAIHHNSSERYTPQVCDSLHSSPFLRSLICDFVLDLPIDSFKLIRVLHVTSQNHINVVRLINLHYLYLPLHCGEIPCSIYMLWNLQSLIIGTFGPRTVAPVPKLFEIWKLPHLRHVIVSVGLYLHDPSSSQMDDQPDFVLENLQTLSQVRDFRCTQEALRKIPNVVKLKLLFTHLCHRDVSRYRLNNLCCLKKLQSLHCEFPPDYLWPNQIYLLRIAQFPLSLRKLTLLRGSFNWEDVTTKIGILPHLEKLKIKYCATRDKWNPVEGQFLKLKLLEIRAWIKRKDNELIYWTAGSVHFPRLEHLVLYSFSHLRKIPSGISIQLISCNNSVVASAFRILEEQRRFGKEDLRVLVDGKPAKVDRSNKN